MSLPSLEGPLPRRLTAGLVLIGLALRAYHYLRDPSVWHDEAALIVNVLENGFGDLLGPLRWDEAGPPLFLWLERTLFLALGDGTFALRLVPFLASCVGLVLFAVLARKLLPPAAACCAVLLFATSDRLLWHACDAKPYALDVLLATGVLACHVFTSYWPLNRRLAVYALAAPVLIWLSYPGVFLCGAMLVSYLPAVVRERRPTTLLLYAFWGLGVATAFALLVLGPVQAQRTGPMDACWTNHFPDWSRPWRVPLWTVAGTWEVVRYCLKPLGQLLLVPVVVGGILWWRAGRRALAVLAVGPLGLALVAAFLNRYPYGGSRLEVFAAPGLILLVAAALEPSLTWLRSLHRWAPVALLLLLATVPAYTVGRLAIPWPRSDCAGAAAYVLDQRSPGEAVAANHWEAVYYFRRLDGPFALLTEEPMPRGVSTLWVVLTAVKQDERQALASSWFDGWRVLDQREFTGAKVLRLQEVVAADRYSE